MRPRNKNHLWIKKRPESDWNSILVFFRALFSLVVISGFLPATAGAFKCTTSYEEGPSLYWGDRNLSIVPSAFPGQDLTADQLEMPEWERHNGPNRISCWAKTKLFRSRDRGGACKQTDLRAGYDCTNLRTIVTWWFFGEASPICRVTLGFFPERHRNDHRNVQRHTGEIWMRTLNLIKTFFLLIAILVQMQPVRWYTI